MYAVKRMPAKKRASFFAERLRGCFAAARDGLDKTIRHVINGSCDPGCGEEYKKCPAYQGLRYAAKEWGPAH